MKKLIPILDHLYIFQNLEYQIWDFGKWFLKHPFKRCLQRKHHLEMTPKALILLVLSLGLMIFKAFYTTFWFGWPMWGAFVLLLIYLQLSPLFLIASQILLMPLEYYSKQKLVKAAIFKRAKMSDLMVIGIVGSFAKTSTKEMLYTLLWQDFRVVKTPKSYNTLVSVARTMLSDLKPNTQVFICEMDAYHPGEIDQLCRVAKPDLGIITAIAPQHLERFGNMESLASTQFEIAKHLSEDGVLYLNADDEWTRKLEVNYQVNKGFFGLSDFANYFASAIKFGIDGMEFKLHTPSGTVDIRLPLLGQHQVVNFVAAAALANQIGLSLKTIQQRALQILPTAHRLEIKKQGDLTIIDNTYNTNPISSRSSLQLLKKYPADKRILITPGLVELGSQAETMNRELAHLAAEAADEIVIVGRNAKAALLEGLKEVEYPSRNIHTVASTQAGLALVAELATKKAVVLLENDLPDQYF